MTERELLDKRAAAWEQAKAIMDRAKAGEDLGAEDEATAQRALDEVDGFTRQLDLVRRAAATEASLDQPAPLNIELPPSGDTRDNAGGGPTGADEYRAAFSKWMKSGARALPAAQQEVLQRGFKDFAGDPEMRALAEGTNSAGGYLVPPGFLQRLVERKALITTVLPVVNVIQTATGNPLQWPTTDLTGTEGELIGENVAVTELDVTFGTATLSAYLYSSKMQRVPYTLLQDSAFDLEAWLPDKLADRLARIQNRHLTLGTGTAQPQGLTNAAVGVTGATGSTVTASFDNIIDLEHSVDPLYRMNGRFMFHDTVLQVLRKIKDTQGRYLWQPGVDVSGTTQNFPDTIHGYPYVINQHMPVMAANAKSIIFGDFKAGYIVRQVRDFTLLRLTERFAEFLQVAFIGFERFDGRLDDLNALRQYQNSAT